MSPLQVTIYPAISRYADVLITSETRKNRDEIGNVATMHVLNHVLTSRTRVQRHNRRIRELGASAAADADAGDVDRWRDQGYARPKVLVLLPTRATCHKFVETIIRLLGSSAIVDNWDRFHEEYGPIGPDAEDGGDVDDDDGEGDGDGGKRDEVDARARRVAVLRQKGLEWNELFGDNVNADDDFKMGLSLTPNFVESSSSAGGKKRKAKRAEAVAGAGASSGVNVKLCADFYRSDIILASPIGLKMAISGNDEDDDEADEPDVDFLSSIDICVICRSDVLLMQNWDHVNFVLDSLNRQPRKVSDIDFSRVRNYHLEGRGSYWRQLILFSQFASPRILSTFRRHAENDASPWSDQRMRAACDVTVHGARQVFQRVTCQSPSEAGPDRLRYFSEHVLPKLTRSGQKHTLIYVPSYFDFIALRNLLLKREVDFVSITEYARVSEVSRGRARFLQGRKSIMLYTGRAHFFLRHKIKGARTIRGVLSRRRQHAERRTCLDDAKDGVVPCTPMSCLSLFTKFDAHQLERIVGTGEGDGDGGKRDKVDARARRGGTQAKGSRVNELFGDNVNADDDFKMGLSHTQFRRILPPPRGGSGRRSAPKRGGSGGILGERQTVRRLLPERHHTGIPIGLKMAISGNDEDDDEADEPDVDFCQASTFASSVIPDVLLMQNWDHVNFVLDSLNRQPRKVSDIDFSRVRNYHLEGRGSYWRQLILFSQFASPRILSTFRRHAENVEGSLRMRRVVRSEDASVCDVTVHGARQVFQRVTCQSPSEAGPDRLRYFSEHAAQIDEVGAEAHAHLRPELLDFIALRNLLLARGGLSNTRASSGQAAAARGSCRDKVDNAAHGPCSLLPPSQDQGARHVISWACQNTRSSHPAVVNMLNVGLSDDAKDGVVPCTPMSCLSLFTKFDAHQLERIVGTSNAGV
ncbi:LOW QUALITY PROTEIN: hypothetical protein ACHAW5_008767 [Stephanodiscus triporus]|uniref:U3 small nucleolar RNA-associated protein 25 n=1 Tax=Stephanodiscus triporus TaxID=2934178 RepID=A0ABD3P651_9STRA